MIVSLSTRSNDDNIPDKSQVHSFTAAFWCFDISSDDWNWHYLWLFLRRRGPDFLIGIVDLHSVNCVLKHPFPFLACYNRPCTDGAFNLWVLSHDFGAVSYCDWHEPQCKWVLPSNSTCIFRLTIQPNNIAVASSRQIAWTFITLASMSPWPTEFRPIANPAHRYEHHNIRKAPFWSFWRWLCELRVATPQGEYKCV